MSWDGCALPRNSVRIALEAVAKQMFPCVPARATTARSRAGKKSAATSDHDRSRAAARRLRRRHSEDRDGGLKLLAILFGLFPFLGKLFADSAYQGPVFHGVMAGILPHIETEIVKRSDRVKGFIVQPRRWVVKRTIPGSTAAPDWPRTGKTALAFLKLASIRFIIQKLCNPP